MAGKIQLDLVTPERLMLSLPVDEVIAPGSEGEFGVLPGHTHFLTTLHIGELRYRTDDRWHSIAVSWGYAQVEPSRVTILAELAEKAEEIDLPRAEAAAAEAQEQLGKPGASPSELDRIRERLAKADLRSRLGARHKSGGSSGRP
ncbi:MAG TPA: F0F1 ATP synthase subunit epsilon [Nitrospiria bacterium]